MVRQEELRIYTTSLPIYSESSRVNIPELSDILSSYVVAKLEVPVGKLTTTFSSHPHIGTLATQGCNTFGKDISVVAFPPYWHHLLTSLDHPGDQRLSLIHFCIPDTWHRGCSIRVCWMNEYIYGKDF